MATFTFRERVMDGREQMKSLQLGMKSEGMGDLHYCWVREYQERGAVHYHFLMEREGLERRGWLAGRWLETVGTGKKARTVVRGPLEDRLVRLWISAVGDCSEEFRAFQWGGIVEPFRAEDGATRYFASYLSKAEQKTLPADAETTGRWWYVCPKAKPVPISRGHLTGWTRPIPLNTLFDKYEMEEHYTCRELPTFIPKHWRPSAP